MEETAPTPTLNLLPDPPLNKTVGWKKIVLISSISALIIFGSAYIYVNYYKVGNSDTGYQVSGGTLPGVIKAAPTPTPIPYNIPEGKQTYRFSNGSAMKGPKIQTAVFDPLDPQQGATQTITLEVESDAPVTSSVITVSSDNKDSTVNLKLILGDSLKGTYSGSWQASDSHESKYAFRFILKSASGTYDNTMRIR